jgi:serine/threonine-protein kinase
VAYWLLTGEFVFTGDTPMALLLQHASALPVPPSARTELPIPEVLDRIVMSCLAKNPAERPPSAKELSRRLADVECAGGWSEGRAHEWWALHQPAFASGATARPTRDAHRR